MQADVACMGNTPLSMAEDDIGDDESTHTQYRGVAGYGVICPVPDSNHCGGPHNVSFVVWVLPTTQSGENPTEPRDQLIAHITVESRFAG
jgi:hypothetical protein